MTAFSALEAIISTATSYKPAELNNEEQKIITQFYSESDIHAHVLIM